MHTYIVGHCPLSLSLCRGHNGLDLLLGYVTIANALSLSTHTSALVNVLDLFLRVSKYYDHVTKSTLNVEWGAYVNC